MIRVNLLQNMAVSTPGGFAGAASELTPDIQKAAAVRLLVIALVPIALFAYEKIKLGEAQERILAERSKVQQARQELAQFGDVAPKVEKYNKEKQRIDKELETVRTLGKNRLREVKALDALQSLIPSKVWARKISITNGIVKLEGNASNDDGVTELLRALESHAYFSKVEPKYTSSENTAIGSIKKFEIEFKIGK